MFVDFFNYVKTFQIFFLFETHVTKDKYSNFSKYFNGFKLVWNAAVRTSGRGRASGGSLFGINTSLLEDFGFMELEGTMLVQYLRQPDMYIVPFYINCNNWSEDFEKLNKTMSLLSNKSVLVIGDLNARIGNMQVTTATTITNNHISQTRRSKDNVCNQNGSQLLQMLQLYDSVVLNGYTDGDNEGHYTFVGGQGKSVIDYCAANNDWLNLVKKFEVQCKTFSDHLPIVVEWTSVNTTYKNLNLLPRLKWKNEDIITYQQNLDCLLLEMHVNTESVEIVSTQLVSSIRDSAKKKMTPYRKPFKQQWFDRECMIARKRSFALLNACRNSDSLALRNWYIGANKHYKMTCKTKKIRFEENQAYQLGLTKNTKEFWKIARLINEHSFVIGTGVSAGNLAIYFKDLLRDKDNLTFCYAEPFITDELLDSEITTQEIDAVLLKSKNGKAPGEDGIPYEFFKNAPRTLTNQLQVLYNNVFASANIPNSFKRSVIFPIHKKGAIDNVENYRGISFMNTIAKIFCGILVSRLEEWVNEHNKLTELQAGFRRNYSTVDHLFSFTSIIKAFQARNKKVYSFFVDFKAAFDLVNRNALIYKLSQLGISSKFLSVIKELYSESKAAVWDGSNLSDWFATDIGVKQGCPLSALLFALFVNDIVAELPGGIRIAGTTVNVLLYADDLVLMSESPEGLQLMINRLATYCKKWGLIINTEKSKIMVFARHTRSSVSNNWFFDGNSLEVTKKHKYLGIELNSTTDFKSHLAAKAATCQSLLNITWRRIFANEHISPSAKYKIYEAVVTSTLCYAAQVWGMDEFDEIEKFQRNFLKKMFNLPMNTPHYAIYLETGLPKLYTSTLKLQADYVIKVLSYPDSRLTKKMLLYEIRNKDWWMSKWQNIGTSFGEDVVIDANSQNGGKLKEQLYKIIQIREDSDRAALIANARQSESRIMYAQLEYNLMNNYFKNSLRYKEISLIFKTRCELISLNGCPYNGSFNQFCTLCNLASKEDCFHFMSVCPIFAQQRLRYFGKKTLSMEETIAILNGWNWKLLYYYVKESYKYRMLIITEFA